MITETDKLEIIVKPNSKPQTEFFKSTEYEVLYGGSAGSGKSFALVVEPLRYIQYPRFTGIIFRRTYPELEGSIIPLAMHYYLAAGATWHEQKKTFTFPSGAKIRLGFMQHAEDWRNYQGHQYTYQGYDELTNFAWEQYEMLAAWNRSPVEGIPAYRRATSNPGGVSHSVVKKYFYDTCLPLPDGPMLYSDIARIWWQPMKSNKTYYTRNEAGRSLGRKFIPARVFDNVDLLKNNPQYVSQLLTLPEKKRKALLEGNWEVYEGQFFCCDDQTEILTEKGFKNILEVAPNEKVATLSPEKEMIFTECSGSHIFDFEGELVAYEGRTLNFATTQNHKAYLRNYNLKDYTFAEYKDFPRHMTFLRTPEKFQGLSPNEIIIEGESNNKAEPIDRICPICEKHYLVKLHRLKNRRGLTCSNLCGRKLAGKNYGLVTHLRDTLDDNYAGWNGKKESLSFDVGDWMELLGWFLSEGSVLHTKYNEKQYPTGFVIAQSFYEWKIDRIRNLLVRMGFKYKFDGRKFKIYSSTLGKWFSQFGIHHQKFIPREYLNFEQKHLQRLYESLMLGDGCPIGVSSYIYATVSEELANNVQELCLRLGKSSTIAKRPPRKQKHRLAYIVSVYSEGNNESYIEKKDIKKKYYKGKVGCVTVNPHHTILVRRNGKCFWTGNSEFNRDVHVVDKRYYLDYDQLLNFNTVGGLDYGNTTSVECVARDYNNNIIVFDELHSERESRSVKVANLKKFLMNRHLQKLRIAGDTNMWIPEAFDVAASNTPAMDYINAGINLFQVSKKSLDNRSYRIGCNDAVKDLLHYEMVETNEEAFKVKPRIVIYERCRHLIETLPLLITDPNDPEDIADKQDDHCFIGNTPVATNKGYIKIKKIKVGDSVLTRKGFKKVTKNHKTDLQDCYYYPTLGLVGTKGHPVYSERGFVAIHNLTLSDILCRLEQKEFSQWLNTEYQKKEFITGLSSDATHSRRFLILGIITDAVVSIIQWVYAICMYMFGSDTTNEKSQKVITYITKMEIELTTLLKILNVKKSLLTYRIMQRSGLRKIKNGLIITWMKFAHWLLNGMEQKKQRKSTLKQQNSDGQIGLKIGSVFAKFVGKLTFLLRPTLSFAHINVIRNINEITPPKTFSKNVNSVKKNITLTNLTETHIAQEVAQSNIPAVYLGKHTVYNLTVEECPEYYANNILVHNCYDAFKMALMYLYVPRKQEHSYQFEWLKKLNGGKKNIFKRGWQSR